MKAVAEMSMQEAIEQALLVMLVTDRFDEEQVRDEFVSYGGSLWDAGGAWLEIKYSGKKPTTKDGLTAQLVAEYGGEGQGEDFWVVISLADEATTRYFRMDGWYASYDGGELDGEPYEVRPQERVVTFYEK